MILGTPEYMAPEQVEGKEADSRTDIFAFGVIMYEMATGRKAFEGDSKASLIAAILTSEPRSITKIQPMTPPTLERVVKRCLAKDPENRWQTARDLTLELKWIVEDLGQRFQHMDDVKVELEEELKEESGKLAETLPAKPASLNSALQARRAWVWAGAALVVVAIAIAAWLFRGTARRPAAAPEVVPLTSYAGIERSPSFSPDGNQVAFSWNGEKQDNFDIYVKLIGSATPLRLTTDPADDICPAFSPDGRSIGFVRVSKERATFMVIPAIGGPERVVADVTFPDFWAHAFFSWFPDGKWIVTRGLTLISTETGETRSLTSPPTKSLPDTDPAVSPDGRTVAFGRWAGYGIHLSSRPDRRLEAQRGAETTDFPEGQPLGFGLDTRWAGNHL